jgi:hypothetical protein
VAITHLLLLRPTLAKANTFNQAFATNLMMRVCRCLDDDQTDSSIIISVLRECLLTCIVSGRWSDKSEIGKSFSTSHSLEQSGAFRP